MVVAVVVSKMTYKKNALIEEEFTAMVADSNEKKIVTAATD